MALMIEGVTFKGCEICINVERLTHSIGYIAVTGFWLNGTIHREAKLIYYTAEISAEICEC